VAEGEELTLDYEYDPYNCPEWFEASLRSFVEEAEDEQLEQLNQKYLKFVRQECTDVAAKRGILTHYQCRST